MRILTIPLLISSIFALGACSGDKSSDTSGTGTDSGTGGDDTSASAVHFSVSGSAANLLTGAAAAADLCVAVADPTAAIGGGELEILGSSTVGADGSFEVDDITTTSSVGLLVLVQDCEGDAVTVLPTATGIPKDSYIDLVEGDVISDFTAYSIDGTSQTSIQASLESAGYTGDLGTDGALVGFVFDSSGAPIDGATVAGASSSTTYYAASDGSYNTTSTAADANAMFMIPAAPVYNYSATAMGYTFTNVLAGSQPGFAVVIKFVAS